jgi:hypothetical protein
VQVGVAAGHFDRRVVEHLLDHRERHTVVDHARAEVMAKQGRVTRLASSPVLSRISALRT